MGILLENLNRAVQKICLLFFAWSTFVGYNMTSQLTRQQYVLVSVPLNITKVEFRVYQIYISAYLIYQY